VINPARLRDFWVLPALLLALAALAVVVRGGWPAPAAQEVAAGAQASSGPATVAPSQEGDDGVAEAPSLDSLPPDTRAQLDALPAGTVLVACSSAFAKYPEGVTPSVSLRWHQTHPGWHLLEHGYCVDNPAMIRTFDPPVMDAP